MAKLIDKDQEYYALKIKILLPHFVPNEEIGRNTKEEKKNAKHITIIQNLETFEKSKEK